MSDCARCKHREDHGWWGTLPTEQIDKKGEVVVISPSHCGDTNVAGVLREGCHRDWTGVREAHCVVCHEHFASNTAADRHEHSVPPEDMVTWHHDHYDPVFRDEETYGGGVWVLAECEESTL